MNQAQAMSALAGVRHSARQCQQDIKELKALVATTRPHCIKGTTQGDFFFSIHNMHKAKLRHAQRSLVTINALIRHLRKVSRGHLPEKVFILSDV